MTLFQRKIPIVPADLATQVAAAGVGGPAEARFAKDFPVIHSVAAFNSAIPGNALTLWNRLLSEIPAPNRKTALSVFVFASLTAKEKQLRELDEKLFSEAALSQGVKLENIRKLYEAVLEAAADPGVAVVRKYMELEKQGKLRKPLLRRFLQWIGLESKR